MLTPHALLELQVDTLFIHDADGRITATNEPNGGPAPLFFLGRTAEHTIWRVRSRLRPDLAARLDALASREPPGQDLRLPPLCAAGVRAALDGAAPITREYNGPAFSFPRQIATVADVVRITAANADLLVHFPALVGELNGRSPCLAIVRDGGAVAVCFSPRRSARADEAGVETLTSYRGRGHATAATAAWARAIQAEGLTPLYSTTWDNEPSRSVARRLGLVQYGANWHVG